MTGGDTYHYTNEELPFTVSAIRLAKLLLTRHRLCIEHMPIVFVTANHTNAIIIIMSIGVASEVNFQATLMSVCYKRNSEDILNTYVGHSVYSSKRNISSKQGAYIIYSS